MYNVGKLLIKINIRPFKSAFHRNVEISHRVKNILCDNVTKNGELKRRQQDTMHRRRHRRDQYYYHRHLSWKQPKFWFILTIAIFVFNLLLALLTIEQHIFEDDADKPALSIPSLFLSTSTPSASNHFFTESRLWHRILLEEELEVKCRSNNKHKKTNATRAFLEEWNKAPQKNELSLVPSGFSTSVREYVEREKKKTSFTGIGSSSSYCIAPASDPSCQSFQYTVVIYSSYSATTTGMTSVGGDRYKPYGKSSDSDYWRRILLLTMKLLAYPSVQRVNMILDIGSNFGFKESNQNKNGTASISSRKNEKVVSPFQNAAKRNKYAKRILQWNEKGICRVITTASSLWHGIEQLDVPSDSILWIDGDKGAIPHNDGKIIINGTQLKKRFRLWREKPNALIIPDGDENDHDISTTTQLQQQIQRAEDAMFPSSDCPILLSPFPFFNLHGLIMHKSYLCYLNHPIIGADLRNYTNSILTLKQRHGVDVNVDVDVSSLSWDITVLSVGIFLSHISDGYIVDNDDHSLKVSANTNDRIDHPEIPGKKAVLMRNCIKQIVNYFGYDGAGKGATRSIRKLSIPSKQQC